MTELSLCTLQASARRARANSVRPTAKYGSSVAVARISDQLHVADVEIPFPGVPDPDRPANPRQRDGSAGGDGRRPGDLERKGIERNTGVSEIGAQLSSERARVAGDNESSRTARRVRRPAPPSTRLVPHRAGHRHLQGPAPAGLTGWRTGRSLRSGTWCWASRMQ